VTNMWIKSAGVSLPDMVIIRSDLINLIGQVNVADFVNKKTATVVGL